MCVLKGPGGFRSVCIISVHESCVLYSVKGYILVDGG